MFHVKSFPQIDGEIGWFELCPNANQRLGKRLKQDDQFDIVIIGAGFAGMSLALRLAELRPQARIALVDALQVGQGSSGRNAGFIVDIPHTLDANLSDPTFARGLGDLNQFAIERLHGFCEKFSIDCQWQQAGKYLAAHESKNHGGIKELVKVLQSVSLDYELLEGNALAQRLGTDYYQVALYTPNNILVNPATLIRGLAQALPESVTLFEESPLIGYQLGRPHQLQFVGGQLQAQQIIFAANAHNAALGQFVHRLIPCFTYASLTEPLSDSLMEAHFANVAPWGLTSAHPMGTTVRLTPDRRLFIRNKFDFEPHLQSTPALLHRAWRIHRQAFEARFPALRHLHFNYTWGGEVCMTMNAEPAFCQIQEDAWLLMGCNGTGITRGTYLGYYMADWMQGIESEALHFIQAHSSPSLVPPEPLRGIGARIRMAYEHARAGGDL